MAAQFDVECWHEVEDLDELLAGIFFIHLLEHLLLHLHLHYHILYITCATRSLEGSGRVKHPPAGVGLVVELVHTGLLEHPLEDLHGFQLEGGKVPVEKVLVLHMHLQLIARHVGPQIHVEVCKAREAVRVCAVIVRNVVLVALVGAQDRLDIPKLVQHHKLPVRELLDAVRVLWISNGYPLWENCSHDASLCIEGLSEDE